MRALAFTSLAFLLGTLMTRAEVRTFTNTDGKKLEAELVAVEDGTAVLRLANDRVANVPLKSLSAEDQSFASKWWEENKDKVGPMDIRLTIDKNTERIERTVVRPKGGGGKNQNANQVTKKHTVDDFNFTCTLKNYSRKNISDITASYTIYKRISGRDKDGLKNKTEEIDGEKTINQLEAHGSASFDTEDVRCEDNSESGGKGPTISTRETVLGIVVTISVGGKDVLKQGYPDNFLDRMEEEEQRESRRN